MFVTENPGEIYEQERAVSSIQSAKILDFEKQSLVYFEATPLRSKGVP